MCSGTILIRFLIKFCLIEHLSGKLLSIYGTIKKQTTLLVCIEVFQVDTRAELVDVIFCGSIFAVPLCCPQAEKMELKAVFLFRSPQASV